MYVYPCSQIQVVKGESDNQTKYVTSYLDLPWYDLSRNMAFYIQHSDYLL